MLGQHLTLSPCSGAGVGEGLCPLPLIQSQHTGWLWAVCCLVPAMFALPGDRNRLKVVQDGHQGQLTNKEKEKESVKGMGQLEA